MFRDYTNYEIFADGRIWSKKYKKFLKPYTMKNGYQIVCLYDNEGKPRNQLVHRVTWIAVNGREVPEGYELNHLDECKTNNHISNLQLCTRKENNNWGTHNERVAKALSKVMKGKFINRQDQSKKVGAFKDGDLVMAFPSTREAHRNGFHRSAIAACCKNCYCGGNKYKGYEWRYLDNE